MEIITQNMSFKHVKRCSTLLPREIQLKTMTQYFSPVRWAKIKQPTVLIKAQGHRNSCTVLVGMKTGVPPFKINFGIIYQIKIQIPFIRVSQKDS